MNKVGLSVDDIQQIVAGFFGSIVGVSKQSHQNFGALVLSVISGTASATYLTPIIAAPLNIKDPKYMLGLSFFMGTLGLRGVEAVASKLNLYAIKDKPSGSQSSD